MRKLVCGPQLEDVTVVSSCENGFGIGFCKDFGVGQYCCCWETFIFDRPQICGVKLGGLDSDENEDVYSGEDDSIQAKPGTGKHVNSNLASILSGSGFVGFVVIVVFVSLIRRFCCTPVPIIETPPSSSALSIHTIDEEDTVSRDSFITAAERVQLESTV